MPTGRGQDIPKFALFRLISPHFAIFRLISVSLFSPDFALFRLMRHIPLICFHLAGPDKSPSELKPQGAGRPWWGEGRPLFPRGLCLGGLGRCGVAGDALGMFRGRARVWGDIRGCVFGSGETSWPCFGEGSECHKWGWNQWGLFAICSNCVKVWRNVSNCGELWRFAEQRFFTNQRSLIAITDSNHL